MYEKISDWLASNSPDDPSRVGAFHGLSEKEAEFGFYKAIATGRVEWIEAFIRESGCDPNRFLEDPAKDGPLRRAIFEGEPASLAKLLSLGADPNVLVNQELGWRPLHVAVDLESTSDRFVSMEPRAAPYTQLLTAFGADPLLRDFSGESPLDWAIKDDSQPARALLESAASSNEWSRLGRLALVRRIATLAEKASGCSPLPEETQIDDPDLVRRVVELTTVHDYPEWIDDDLLRLCHWLIDLADLSGAERAALSASERHPFRASALVRVAIRSAQAGVSHWPILMASALDSASHISPAVLRIEPSIVMASFLMGSGDREAARRLLFAARESLAEEKGDRRRDEILADIAYRLSELSMTFEAIQTSSLIADSKLRWLMRRKLLLRQPPPPRSRVLEWGLR